MLGGTSDDGTVKLWDVHERREIAAFPKCQWVGFISDGSLLAYVGFGSPSSIKLWDVHERREAATLPPQSDGVEFIVFSPDGSLLAEGGGGLHKGTVRLWDVHKRSEFGTLSDPSRPFLLVGCAAFSPDGSLFACACGCPDGTVLWEVPFEGVLPRVGWERIQAVRQKATEAAEERERMARQAAEEQERKAKEAAETRQRKAREAAEAAQRQLDREMLEIERRRSGLCIRCGTKLSMLRRLSGHGDCGRC